MRYMTLDLADGHVVEVVCCQSGAFDGRLMGYAIKFGGSWDGWVLPVHDHATMHKFNAATSREDAIKTVVQNWN